MLPSKEESKEENTTLSKDDFAVAKKQINSEHPIIGRLDSQSLLQIYIPQEKDGNWLYYETNKYKGWTTKVAEAYVKIDVNIVRVSKNLVVVEWPRNENRNKENEVAKIEPNIDRDDDADSGIRKPSATKKATKGGTSMEKSRKRQTYLKEATLPANYSSEAKKRKRSGEAKSARASTRSKEVKKGKPRRSKRLRTTQTSKKRDEPQPSEKESTLFTGMQIEQQMSSDDLRSAREIDLLKKLEIEVEKNKKLIADVASARSDSRYQTELLRIKAESQKMMRNPQMDHLQEKYRRCKSYRKSLIWQKAYLLTRLENYQGREAGTIDHLAKLYRANVFYQNTLTPKQRFRVLGYMAIAVERFKYIGRRSHERRQ